MGDPKKCGGSAGRPPDPKNWGGVPERGKIKLVLMVRRGRDPQKGSQKLGRGLLNDPKNGGGCLLGDPRTPKMGRGLQEGEHQTGPNWRTGRPPLKKTPGIGEGSLGGTPKLVGGVLERANPPR